MAEDYISFLPLYLVLVPLLAGVLLFFLPEQKMMPRRVLSLGASLFALGGALFMAPRALVGRVCCDLIDFMQFGLQFSVDIVSWIFALFISLIWVLAVLFSFSYMAHSHNLRRYYSVLTFTLGAILGVVFAGDFLTLFIFFEIMTFSSFVLVIHRQDREALQAGSLYIYMAIFGGLALLFAILLLFGSTGTLEIIPLLSELGARRTAILVLFLIGFGIKAGLVPLHLWLPLAHPVAPSPASALLSGIMIKAGAYGILRVTMVLYRPGPDWSAGYREYLVQAGYVLVWLGIVSLLAGALMALFQGNAKRILAYSSISQMGVIVAGLGTAMLMGQEGAMGFTGSLYHIINHAFFKAGLFAMIGAVYMYTHQLDLSALGGMARRLPLVAVTFAVAALGIAGVPGFNGYAGKTLVHDALLEAYAHHGFYGLFVTERLFVIGGALTICYFIKLFSGVFLGPLPEGFEEEKNGFRLPPSAALVFSIFAGIVLAIGLVPNWILETFLLPATHLFGFTGEGLEHLGHFQFFAWHPLQSALVVILLAILFYLPAASRDWFSWSPPPWLSLHGLILRPLPRLALSFFLQRVNINDMALGQFYDHSESDSLPPGFYPADLEHLPDDSQDEAGQSAYYTGGKAFEREKRIREQLRIITWWDQEQWNIKNLNFDNLLLAVVLGVILFVVFSTGA